MRGLLLCLALLFVRWTYEPEYIDRLEYSADLVTWSEVEGVYEVLEGEFRVPAPGPGFFRVRRRWAPKQL